MAKILSGQETAFALLVPSGFLRFCNVLDQLVNPPLLTNILILEEFILDALEKGYQVDTICTELS